MFWIYLFVALLAGITLILFFSPLVVTVDTNRREFAVRWTVLFRALVPLPGGSGRARLYLAGIPVPFPRFRRKPRRVRKKKPRPELFPRIFRFLRYCAADRTLRRAVVIAGGKLARGSLHSSGVSRWHAEVSLPDPALNGMLAGWIAAARAAPWIAPWIAPARWAGGSPVGVNFLGRNWLELEVRFYPYRLALAGSAFVFRLPHRAILSHWKHSGHWMASKTS